MWFRGWHPEGAIRYLPVVNEIKWLTKSKRLNRRYSRLSVLEIGAGAWGIVPYLGREVDAVDPLMKKPLTPDLHLKNGTATRLPFEDQSYDVVISVDTFEHLSKKDRQKAMDELIRVAKHLAVVAVPCGKAARKHDMRMDLLWQFWRGKGHEPMMAEHAKYGLSDCEEVEYMIYQSLKKYKRKGKIRAQKNLNLAVRQFLIQWWIMPWKWSYYVYLKGLLPIVLFRKFLNFGSCYRSIYTVSLQNNDSK